VTEDGLNEYLASLQGAVVAFSGGVDSTVLLALCVRALGAEHVLAVIADSPSLARGELVEARQIAGELGVTLRELKTEEFSDPNYRANQGDRCFWCKEALFAQAVPLANDLGWPLLYGENASDDSSARPGSVSAKNRGVQAPLRAFGWTKSMVRDFARHMGLSVADKPAMPCLSSRIPVGIRVERDSLARVEALESVLRAQGMKVIRARDYGPEKVRLEIGPEEWPNEISQQDGLIRTAQECGYTTVELGVYGSLESV